MHEHSMVWTIKCKTVLSFTMCTGIHTKQLQQNPKTFKSFYVESISRIVSGRADLSPWTPGWFEVLSCAFNYGTCAWK